MSFAKYMLMTIFYFMEKNLGNIYASFINWNRFLLQIKKKFAITKKISNYVFSKSLCIYISFYIDFFYTATTLNK